MKRLFLCAALVFPLLLAAAQSGQAAFEKLNDYDTSYTICTNPIDTVGAVTEQASHFVTMKIFLDNVELA